MPETIPLPPRRPGGKPGNPPADMSTMTGDEADVFMKSRKAGGRSKKKIGGGLAMLSPLAMGLNALSDDKDEKKSGGRAKKMNGGPMGQPGPDQRLGMVSDKMMNFGAGASGSPYKKGGKAKRPGKFSGGGLGMGGAMPATPSMGGQQDVAGVMRALQNPAGPLNGMQNPGAMMRKSGGRTKKGKTNVTVIVNTGPPKGAEMPPPGPPGGKPSPVMPPPGAGAAPPPGMGMPPGAGAPPPPPPGAGLPPGLMAAMGRKRGGRTVTKSTVDLTAGAGSGEGRLQKTAMQKATR